MLQTISREAYEKFIQDIQKQIDDADKSSKEKAENIIKSMTDSYNKAIQERIAYELEMAMSEGRTGNLSEAQRHRIMAEIYVSVLGATSNARQ